MTFILEPLNENQEMNAMQTVTAKSPRAACDVAGRMAGAIQAAMPDCSITVRVRMKSKSRAKYTEEKGGFIVRANGDVCEEETGYLIHIHAP